MQFLLYLFLLSVFCLVSDQSPAADSTQPSRWIGVVDEQTSSFGWPGSGFTVRFSGAALSVTLENSGRMSMIVDIDGSKTRLDLDAGRQSYQVASGLPQGMHLARLTRRAENISGDTTFVSASTDGAFLPDRPADRKLLIVGDSISVGYGLEGQGVACPPNADLTNSDLTYGALTARHFNADLATIAVSGIGISKNDPGLATPTMIRMLDKPTPSTPQDAGAAIKDAGPFQIVVVNLGTNDFGGGKRPTSFVADDRTLLARIRALQPQALIYAVLGPMLDTADFAAAEQAINDAVRLRQQDGDRNIQYLRLKNGLSTGLGCDWHPNAEAHRVLADIFTNAIRHDTGWSFP